jgi:hypothetical protein
MAEIAIEHRIEDIPSNSKSIHFKHIYLVFTDDSGNEFLISSYKEENKLGVIVGENFDMVPKGNRDYRPNTEEDRIKRHHRVLSLDGRDPDIVWDQMVQQANNISQAHLPYITDWTISVGDNDNNAVASVLNAVGIDIKDIHPEITLSEDYSLTIRLGIKSYNQTIELAEAIFEGKTPWLKDLLSKRLPNLPTDAEGCGFWYKALLRAFEDRNLIKPSQQKIFLTQVRNAIKVINPEHPALNVVKFDTETWVEINNTDVDRIANRTTQLISNPDAIVETAIELIKSNDWSEIAAGLAVLTGRRSTEVIQTAQFEFKSEYSVLFSGSLKKKVGCVYEIPTLCKARLVIEAIANIRTFLGPQIQDLSSQRVHAQYSRSVSEKCDRHFNFLVLNQTREDNLYTHLFRVIYATIASYWYCPPAVPEIEYRAAIQGHYQILDEKNPELRRALEAERHYHKYKIADSQGNIDGRLGIKLGQPGVKILEAFSHR